MPEDFASDDLSETLARMGAVLFSEQTLDAVLSLVVNLAVESLTSVGDASITLRTGAGSELTSNASSGRAIELDEAQYESDRGPCLTASRTGELIVTPIEANDPRWPEYASAAIAHG